MTDARIQEWLNRLPRNGPWLVSMVLASLIVVELARAAIMLLGAGQVRSVLPTPVGTGQVHQRRAADVQAITNAHLFGIADPDPSTQDPANAPLSSASLVLAGTIATNDPKHGVAIISDGGPSKVYSVGDNVSGTRLHSVYLDHVILDRAGALETLVMPRQLAPSRPIVARAPAPSPVQNLRSLVEKDPAILSQIMRAVPSYDSNAGKLRGFRIYPARNRNAFNNLGLRPGDLVTAINGASLDDPQENGLTRRGSRVFVWDLTSEIGLCTIGCAIVVRVGLGVCGRHLVRTPHRGLGRGCLHRAVRLPLGKSQRVRCFEKIAEAGSARGKSACSITHEGYSPRHVKGRPDCDSIT